MLALRLTALLYAAVPPAPPLDELFARVDASVVTVRVGMKQTAETDTQSVVSFSIMTGSGVLVLVQDGAGWVVTAAHVVEDAEAVQVLWRDGVQADARVISLSRTEDLALLKVTTLPDKPVVAKLGDSEALRPGMRLFAIGAPFGLEHSLTAGIVSALRNNPQRGLTPRRLLQTDVPINQGNSGGPLFNEAGEVVGIASFILSQSGGSMGLNFAVPSNAVRARLFDAALPWIGVSLRFIPRDVAEIFNWPFEAGFLVEKVRPGSAAERAGLRGGMVEAVVGGNPVWLGGDFIVKVNGVDADSTERIGEVLKGLKGGDVIHYAVMRGGRLGTVDVTVPDGLALPRLAPLKTGR
jgi:serine protease Do